MNNQLSFAKDVNEFISLWKSGIPYLECHTSGSTGTPKNIRLSRNLIIDSARRSNDFFCINPNSHLHLVLPISYIAGKMVVVRALEAGCKFTFETPSSTPLKECNLHQSIDLLSVIPSQIPFLNDLRKKGLLPPIHHLLAGGAPTPRNIAQMSKNVAERVWESYGMTETASHIALRPLGSDKPFSTLKGIEVNTDSGGRLIIDLPHSPRLTTNDLAIIEPGKGFHIIGRADNVIISGGLKVNLDRLENSLLSYLPPMTYISWERDNKWGQVPVAVSNDARATAEVLKSLNKTNKPHERVRTVYEVQELSYTHTGKLKRIPPAEIPPRLLIAKVCV